MKPPFRDEGIVSFIAALITTAGAVVSIVLTFWAIAEEVRIRKLKARWLPIKP